MTLLNPGLNIAKNINEIIIDSDILLMIASLSLFGHNQDNGKNNSPSIRIRYAKYIRQMICTQI